MGYSGPGRRSWGAEAERFAFRQAYDRLLDRVQPLVALPIETMAAGELRECVQKIGAMDGATDEARRNASGCGA